MRQKHLPMDEWLKILLPVTRRLYVAPSDNDTVILKKFLRWATESSAYHRPDERLLIQGRMVQAVKIMRCSDDFIYHWKCGEIKMPHALYAALVEPEMLRFYPDLPRPSYRLVEWVCWLIEEWNKRPWKKKGRKRFYDEPLEEIKSPYVLNDEAEEEDIFSPPVRRVVAVDTPGNTDAVESEKQDDIFENAMKPDLTIFKYLEKKIVSEIAKAEKQEGITNGIDGQGIAGPHR